MVASAKATVASNTNLEKKYSAATLVGFVCGLLAFLLSSCIYFGLPLSLIAISQSRRGAREVPSTLSKRGFLLGYLSLILTVLIFAFGLLFLLAGTTPLEFIEEIYDHLYYLF